MEKKSVKPGKILKIAAISGVLLIVLAVIGVILSEIFKSNTYVLNIWSIVQSIIYNLFAIIFVYGFYVLGKKYNNAFLKVMVILSIVFTIIAFFVSIFVVSPMLGQAFNIFSAKAITTDLGSMTNEQAQIFWADLLSNKEFVSYFSGIIFLFAIGLVCMMAISILFGIGLIKLKNKVKYAKIAGILEIVGAATVILIVGLFVLLTAFIFKLIILFREAKK
jgi:hypothetical protein